jgi:hypothetical protein
MDKWPDLESYANELFSFLQEHFDGWRPSGTNDFLVVEKWFQSQIEPAFLLLLKDELPATFNLREIDELVQSRYANYCLTGQTESPYQRLNRLIEFVEGLFKELGVEDATLVSRLKELQSEENLESFRVEKRLQEAEEALFQLLKERSPFAKECEERAERLVEDYSFYWHSKVLELTKEALIKKCLREKHGVPEFTVLGTA